VQRALRGDDEAFGELVERYQAMIASVAWKFGTPASEIEDAVSDVFLKVYRNLNRYKPEHAFSTWLYRVAANAVVDRSRRRRPWNEDGVELEDHVAAAPASAHERVERTERVEALRAALRDLPTKQRLVIVLVHVEGMTVHEAARTLDVPEGTVKTRLMRGRRALREILESRCPELFGEETP
jgi:RNA polymerase sigma-70 factor (ECF subfamily)